MADAPEGQSCGKCRYYRAEWHTVNGSFQGECWRYPPTQRENTIYCAEPPTVLRHSHCGEYAPANPETVPDAAATLARFVLLGDMTAARALADKLRE